MVILMLMIVTLVIGDDYGEGGGDACQALMVG